MNKENKKRVLFVTASTQGGGAERMLFYIMRSIGDNFETRLFITSKDKVPAEYAHDIIAQNANKNHAISAFSKLLKYIRAFKPDHTFTTSSNVGYMLILAKKILGKKFSVNIRCAVTPSEIYHSDIKSRLLNHVIKLTYNYADKIIAQTEFMKGDLISSYNISEEKVQVIRNIVDFNMIESLSSKFIPTEISAENKNIVAAGALYSVKGFDLLIDAIAPLLKTYNARLYILGEERYETGYRSLLEEQIKKHNLSDKVFLLGHKDNPYPYYKAADLFVMSSRKEGYPNVVLEALSLSTPVVATDCVDWTGVIEDGVNGFVAKRNNIESLNVALKKALTVNLTPEKVSIKNYDYNEFF